RQRVKSNPTVRRVGVPARDALRRASARLARRLGDPTMRFGTVVGERYPQLVADPGFALELFGGADRLYREGVFDITRNVTDWGVFARHAPPGHFYSPVPNFHE